MNKKIEDYLHLYLGVRERILFIEKSNYYFVHELKIHKGDTLVFLPHYLAAMQIHGEGLKVKLLLRPLSDMTEEEMKELYNIKYFYGNSAHPSEIKKAVLKPNMSPYLPNIIEIHYAGKEGSSGYKSGVDIVYLNQLSAEQHKYLLSKHFDLFGLIESGLAITQPSKTIKEPADVPPITKNYIKVQSKESPFDGIEIGTIGYDKELGDLKININPDLAQHKESTSDAIEFERSVSDILKKIQIEVRDNDMAIAGDTRGDKLWGIKNKDEIVEQLIKITQKKNLNNE